MKYLVCLVAAFTLIGCKKEQDISNAELYTLTGNAVLNYHETKDMAMLQQVYDTLKHNKEFRKKGLTKNNYAMLYPVFFNLKKFDDLDKLLKQDIGINNYTRVTARNIARYYANRTKDPDKAKSYLQENIKLITDSLAKSPKDSVLYVDYFVARRMLVGKQQTLTEIDSMETVNHNFSKVFYDAMLRDSVKSYPVDL